MRTIPIEVDADISLAELMFALKGIDCTLHGDGRGGLVIVPIRRTVKSAATTPVARDLVVVPFNPPRLRS